MRELVYPLLLARVSDSSSARFPGAAGILALLLALPTLPPLGAQSIVPEPRFYYAIENDPKLGDDISYLRERFILVKTASDCQPSHRRNIGAHQSLADPSRG